MLRQVENITTLAKKKYSSSTTIIGYYIHFWRHICPSKPPHVRSHRLATMQTAIRSTPPYPIANTYINNIDVCINAKQFFERRYFFSGESILI